MIKNDNVEDLIGIANTKPEEAAENIKYSSEVGMPPDSFKQVREEMIPKLQFEGVPKSVPKAVADRMVQSEQHASIIKEDLGVFDAVGKYMSFVGDSFKGKNINRDIFDLN